ncbi:MAG: hypothetical protein JWP81_3895 [Ferruginibacter sp.]|nr:hypothetical protein [Ferruginibacter sp.]
MENIEYIEDYFKSNPNDKEKQAFEQRIISDNSFAEEVAFYISANGVIKDQLLEEKKQRFRKIYDDHKVIPFTKRPVNKFVRYLAAACVVAAVILLTWFLKSDSHSPQQLADKYIDQNWQTMSGTMSSSQDSLQTGLALFNSHKYNPALEIFETLAKTDPANYTAKKYAGIVAVQLGDYEKALTYFTRLETDTALYNNPGKFYKAITVMKRNGPGDKESAKALLKEVSDQPGQEMEGKAEAAELLKKLQ